MVYSMSDRIYSVDTLITFEGTLSSSTMTASQARTSRSSGKSSFMLDTRSSPCMTVTTVLFGSKDSTTKSVICPVGITTASAVGEKTE